jgi:CMP/dCMP kinase
LKKKKQNKGYIVAIDGPAGAGKSTVSRKLAELLEGKLLDTGAMYRAVGYFALKDKAETPEEFRLIAERIEFDMDPKTGATLINGEDFGHKIRTEKVSLRASEISQHSDVRKILTKRQRAIARKWSRKFPIIVEGRDIGTVVFPKVRFKFFVTASSEVRAKRRYEQLKRHEGTKGVTLKSILKQQEKRDDQDAGRRVAPLRCPKDAVVVDTSELMIGQVVQFMASHIKGRNFPEK